MKKLIIILMLFMVCNNVYAESVFMPNITESETKEKLLQLSGRDDFMLTSENEHILVFEKHKSWDAKRNTYNLVGHYFFGTQLNSDPVAKITISFSKKDDGVLINCACDVTLNNGQPDEATMRNEEATAQLTKFLQEGADARAKRLGSLK